jgi:osmotically-inducible protein OsmY
MNQDSIGMIPSEQQVQSRVTSELISHPLLKRERIEVKVVDHVVTLKGVVDSLDKKWIAEDIAADSIGVLEVHNEITVISKNEEAHDTFYDD